MPEFPPTHRRRDPKHMYQFTSSSIIGRKKIGGIPVFGRSGIIGFLEVEVGNPTMQAIGEVVTPTSEISSMTSIEQTFYPAQASETATMTTEFTTSVA